MRKKTMSVLYLVLTVITGIALLTSFLSCKSTKTPAVESKPVLRFADGGWESVQVHNRIVAFIAEHGYGYPKSEFIPGETIPLFAGLSKGDIDVNMEIWTENQQEAYDKAIAAG